MRTACGWVDVRWLRHERAASKNANGRERARDYVQLIQHPDEPAWNKGSGGGVASSRRAHPQPQPTSPRFWRKTSRGGPDSATVARSWGLSASKSDTRLLAPLGAPGRPKIGEAGMGHIFFDSGGDSFDKTYGDLLARRNQALIQNIVGAGSAAAVQPPPAGSTIPMTQGPEGEEQMADPLLDTPSTPYEPRVDPRVERELVNCSPTSPDLVPPPPPVWGRPGWADQPWHLDDSVGSGAHPQGPSPGGPAARQRPAGSPLSIGKPSGSPQQQHPQDKRSPSSPSTSSPLGARKLRSGGAQDDATTRPPGSNLARGAYVLVPSAPPSGGNGPGGRGSPAPESEALQSGAARFLIEANSAGFSQNQAAWQASYSRPPRFVESGTFWRGAQTTGQLGQLDLGRSRLRSRQKPTPNPVPSSGAFPPFFGDARLFSFGQEDLIRNMSVPGGSLRVGGGAVMSGT